VENKVLEPDEVYQLFIEMYTKRVSEHTSACKKRTLDEMLAPAGIPVARG
jgi:hypothetical protein